MEKTENAPFVLPYQWKFVFQLSLDTTLSRLFFRLFDPPFAHLYVLCMIIFSPIERHFSSPQNAVGLLTQLIEGMIDRRVKSVFTWRHGAYDVVPKQWNFSPLGNEFFPYVKISWEHQYGRRENDLLQTNRFKQYSWFLRPRSSENGSITGSCLSKTHHPVNGKWRHCSLNEHKMSTRP